MIYPTIEQVEKATHYDICKWWRFLPSPGTAVLMLQTVPENAPEIVAVEVAVMDRIAVRLNEFGGFTPEISKALGWKS